MSSSSELINKELLVMINEHLRDPKYKTEICNKWKLYGQCPYSNKCRFSHGNNELMNRVVHEYRTKNQPRTVQKEHKCKDFYEKGICFKGKSCSFSHDIRLNKQINEIESVMLLEICNPNNSCSREKRLHVFKKLIPEKNEYMQLSSCDSDKQDSLNSTREEIELRNVRILN